MVLLLFDIDGTLTDTNSDDDRLFRQALAEVAGDKMPPIRAWESFSEVTDAALARSILSAAHGRRARDGEIFAVRERFIELWRNALDTGAGSVTPIPGAREILLAARSAEGFFPALATGGWGPTAQMKLTHAGFVFDDLVLVSSDDDEERHVILNTAAMYAAAARGIPGFSDVVVVGDAVWDARAAGKVGAGMVGRASDPEQIMRLRTEGVAAVVPDFLDTAAFWRAVDKARSQRRATSGN